MRHSCNLVESCFIKEIGQLTVPSDSVKPSWHRKSISILHCLIILLTASFGFVLTIFEVLNLSFSLKISNCIFSVEFTTLSDEM